VVLALLVCGFQPMIEAQERVTGRLTSSGASEYEGFPFAAYRIEARGGRLSITLSSTVSTVLLLRGPDNSTRTNDGARGTQSAVIEIENAARGVWIALATSYYARAEGSFTMAVGGATAVRPVSREELGEQALSTAFAARSDVANAIAERARRLALLKEQLTLATFRSQLASKLRAALEQPDRTAETERKEYDRLEARRRELDAAVKEIQTLGSSREFVAGLLGAEVKNTEAQLSSTSSRLNASVTAREAYKTALSELGSLDNLVIELNRLRDLLSRGDLQNQSPTELRARIATIQTDVERLANTVASRLLDSRFVRELTFADNIGTLSTLLALSNDELRAVEGRFLSNLDVERARSSFRFGAERFSDAAFKIAGSSGTLSRASTNAIDYSVWLPTLFPWPPPEASSRIVLSTTHWTSVVAGLLTLGDVDTVLTQALNAEGYAGASYWGVRNGFALVTPLEQTDARGVALDGASRWSRNIAEMKSFSPTEYIRALLTAPPGYFRVIVFIVTSDSFTTTGTRGLFSTIELWATGGHTFLPDGIRSQPFTNQHKLTALVYEFQKKKSSDNPSTAVPGRYTAQVHLERSKLMSYLLARR